MKGLGWGGHLEDALVGSETFQVVEAKVEVVGGYVVAKVAWLRGWLSQWKRRTRSLLDNSVCELFLAVALRMLGPGQPGECRVWRRHARISLLGIMMTMGEDCFRQRRGAADLL